jgi:hypothetical protein
MKRSYLMLLVAVFFGMANMAQAGVRHCPDRDGGCYDEPGYGPEYVDQELLVDASYDLVDALRTLSDRARRHSNRVAIEELEDEYYWFSDRASNLRHYVDADVVNALRDGASPRRALNRLRDLEPLFVELDELYFNLYNPPRGVVRAKKRVDLVYNQFVDFLLE